MFWTAALGVTAIGRAHPIAHSSVPQPSHAGRRRSPVGVTAPSSMAALVVLPADDGIVARARLSGPAGAIWQMGVARFVASLRRGQRPLDLAARLGTRTR